DLLEAGQITTLQQGPHETALRRALGSLLHVDDALRIDQYRRFAQANTRPEVAELDVRARRLFHMLAAVLTEQVLKGNETLQDAADVLWDHPQVLADLDQLLDVFAHQNDHVHTPLSTHPDVPLRV